MPSSSPHPTRSTASRARRLERHPNVVVLRTFSKAYGLAGLRVGYAIGHARILDAARSTSIPLSVTAHAEEAALASLDAEDELLAARRASSPSGATALAQRPARAADGACPTRRATSSGCRPARAHRRVAAAFDAAGLIVRPFAGDGLRISVGEEDSVEKVLRIAASV